MEWEYKLQIGQNIAGKYLVAKQLGHGLKAETYKVTCDNQSFALKIPLIQAKDLEKEHEILSRVFGVPGALKVFELGELDNGNKYLITEYVDTDSWDSFRDLKHTIFNQSDILPRFIYSLRFLEGLHKEGIEYYDTKPEHFLWDLSKKNMIVIDYNLSVIHEKPEQTTNNARLRWIIADLRRLARTIQYTLLARDQLGVDDMPDAAEPLVFPGKFDPYAHFLPARLDESPKDEFRQLEKFLHFLHGGMFSSANEAYQELEGLINKDQTRILEQEIIKIETNNRRFVEDKVKTWNAGGVPHWDEVEECWGRLGEPALQIRDYKDETVAYTYLWAYAIANCSDKGNLFTGQQIIELLQGKPTTQANQIEDKNDVTLNPATEWLVSLRPSLEVLYNRRWHEVINSLEYGYSVCMEKLTEFRNWYAQDVEAGNLVSYILARKKAVARLARKDRSDYLGLIDLGKRLRDPQDLLPHPKDQHLIIIEKQEAKHSQLHQDLILAVAALNQEKAHEIQKELLQTDREIWREISFLLHPDSPGDHEFSTYREEISKIVMSIFKQTDTLLEVFTGSEVTVTLGSWETGYSNNIQKLCRKLDIAFTRELDLVQPGILELIKRLKGTVEQTLSEKALLLAKEKDQLEEINTQFRNLDGIRKNLEEEIDEKAREISTQQRSIGELQTLQQQLTERNDTLQSQKSTLEQEKIKLSQKRISLEKAIKEMEMERIDLNQSYAGLLSQHQNLSKLLKKLHQQDKTLFSTTARYELLLICWIMERIEERLNQHYSRRIRMSAR